MQIFNKLDAIPNSFHTSKGNQTKFEVNGFWYKLDQFGKEGLSEYVVSKILEEQSLLPDNLLVQYKIEEITINEEQKFGCVSKDFTNGKQIVTLYDLILHVTGKPVEEFYKNLSTEEKIIKTVEFVTNLNVSHFGEYLTLLLEVDAFFLNEDRHLNNIALLKDNEKLELCPIFDNGASLLFDKDININEIPSTVSKIKAKPFSTSFDKQIEICERLYGKQLKFTKEPELTEDIQNNICSTYGEYASKRIELILKFQRMKYKEYIQDVDIDKEDDFLER